MAEAQTPKERVEMLAEILLEHIGNIDEKINEAVMAIAEHNDEIIRRTVRDELAKHGIVQGEQDGN